jgi:hypothetical protein
MPSPSSATLPLEARQVAWSRLWQVLLREPSNEDVEKWETEPARESPETGEAIARAPPDGGDDSCRVRVEP